MGCGRHSTATVLSVVLLVLLLPAEPIAATNRLPLGRGRGQRIGRGLRGDPGDSTEQYGWAAASPAQDSKSANVWEELDKEDLAAMAEQQDTPAPNVTSQAGPAGASEAGNNFTVLVCSQTGEDSTHCEELPASEEMLESLTSDDESGGFYQAAGGKMQALVVVFLAACAGCTGCGLVLACLSGLIALSRWLSRAQRQDQQAQELNEGATDDATAPARPAGTPPKPVVIVTPTNEVLVGFEVKVPKVAAVAMMSPNRESSGRITVGPVVSPTRATASHLPRHLLMSPLSWQRRRAEQHCEPDQNQPQPVSPPRPSTLSPSQQAHVTIEPELSGEDSDSGAGSSSIATSP